MSEIIYHNVVTPETLDRGERIERTVDIYESSDSVRNHKRQQELHHTGSVSVKNRRHRAVQVCLWLLCVLLLTAVIVLCVYFTTDGKHLLTHNYNHLKNQSHELQSALNDSKQLLALKNTNISKLQEEKAQCLLNTKSLSEEKDQLMNERQELNRWFTEQDRRSDHLKWVYYNFSFYYFSSEWKIWSDSRQFCKERGADLVIINNKEEQEVLKKAIGYSYFWIGLSKERSVWKWVDGTAVKTGYWMYGYPKSYSDYCAIISSPGWNDYSCKDKNGCICEKRILKPLT